ncbi:MAG: tRNA dihydrouridine synthase [Patescibacteria group bacterium]
MKNFWKTLKPGFSVLAPMEDVTDTVFRQVIIKAGKPDVMFTEFTNCDGICSVGQAKLIHRLKYSSIEKPLVAQIWGATPKNYYETAKLCLNMGFDGIDINMGCPEKSVIKQGACSALINDHQKAKEIIEAVKQGSEGKIPISVKTRIGFDKIDTEEWIGFLLHQNIQALTIHGRTVKELSDVPNHFDQILKARELRDDINKETVIIANGDIIDIHHGKVLCNAFVFDGFMIGRGVFSNPWCFNEDIEIDSVTKQQRLELLKFHLDLWETTWKENKHYPKLKKYFKIYCQSFPLASDLRIKLMETYSIKDAKTLLIDNTL